MNIVTKIHEWTQIRNKITEKTLGFVPTMGHLHEGHLSLCKRAQSENTITAVSIFVNPVQFNETADFDKYPRTIEKDIALLSDENIDYLFLPEREEIYQDNYECQIIENVLTKELEGEFRPGHFSGMLTVVLKLLNIIGPHRAYFGEKDFQQLILIKKMVNAFFMPMKVIGCPTIRDDNGLALSSRNSRLNAEQKLKAAQFAYLLKSDLDCTEIKEKLTALGFKVDYISEKWNRRLGAVWMDGVRLIDNIAIGNSIC